MHTILWLAISMLLATVFVQAAQLPDVDIRMHLGRPLVFVGGEPQPLPGYCPMSWSKYYTELQVPRFAQHGMGVYHVAFPWLPGTIGGTQHWIGDEISEQPLVKIDQEGAFKTIDETIAYTMAQDPNAYIMIRFGIDPAESWQQLHEDQFFQKADGTYINSPSLASDLYWEAAARYSKAIVRYCESRPFADRIIGYNNFYHCEGVHPPVVYGELFDHNPLMTARWRAYLATKYVTVDKLRRVYGDDSITFETAKIPSDKMQDHVQEASSLLYWQSNGENQPLRDYLEMNRDLFHERFTQVIEAMREGTDRQVPFLFDALKQTMQGWNCGDFFFVDSSRNLIEPELMAGSGSMEVSKLYDIPGFSGLITPHDYQVRGVGGVFEPEGIADSLVLNGKLFLTEMDTRMYPDKYNGYGKAANDQEAAAITWRNLATSLTRGFYFYWMDLSDDWFSTDSIQKMIHRQVQVVKESVNWPHETVPGIAMILDDSAALETNGAGNFLNEAVMWEQKMGMARCGVPYRIYLLDDLALPNFPRHRVYYFPNLFKVDDARLTLLRENVFRDGNVVVWGPGSGISDGSNLSIESAERLTGFQFQDLWRVNYPRRTLISNFDHPITRDLKADTVIGGSLSYGPLLFPKDGTRLGLAWTKQGRDYSGLAVKEFGKGAGGAVHGKASPGMGDYASVFATSVPLPADLWRGLARFAGVHVYTEYRTS